MYEIIHNHPDGSFHYVVHVYPVDDISRSTVEVLANHKLTALVYYN